jgi:hypothetical protein
MILFLPDTILFAAYSSVFYVSGSYCKIRILTDISVPGLLNFGYNNSNLLTANQLQSDKPNTIYRLPITDYRLLITVYYSFLYA